MGDTKIFWTRCCPKNCSYRAAFQLLSGSINSASFRCSRPSKSDGVGRSDSGKSSIQTWPSTWIQFPSTIRHLMMWFRLRAPSKIPAQLFDSPRFRCLFQISSPYHSLRHTLRRDVGLLMKSQAKLALKGPIHRAVEWKPEPLDYKGWHILSQAM